MTALVSVSHKFNATSPLKSLHKGTGRRDLNLRGLNQKFKQVTAVSIRGTTVEPLVSGHPWDRLEVSAYEGCPLTGG